MNRRKALQTAGGVLAAGIVPTCWALQGENPFFALEYDDIKIAWREEDLCENLYEQMTWFENILGINTDAGYSFIYRKIEGRPGMEVLAAGQFADELFGNNGAIDLDGRCQVICNGFCRVICNGSEYRLFHGLYRRILRYMPGVISSKSNMISAARLQLVRS